MFSNSSDQELRDLEELVRKMKENGTFEDFTIKLKHDTALDVGRVRKPRVLNHKTQPSGF